MKETDQSSQHTGAGEPSASVCAGCSAWLTTEEVYCCAACVDVWVEMDPNGLMGVGDE